MKINRRSLAGTTLLLVPVIFLVIIVVAIIMSLTGTPEFHLGEIFLGGLYVTVISFVLWFPTILLWLFLEWAFLRGKKSEGELAGIMAAEVIIPTVAIHLIFPEFEFPIGLYAGLVAFLTQLVRYLILSRKNRLFIKA